MLVLLNAAKCSISDPSRRTDRLAAHFSPPLSANRRVSTCSPTIPKIDKIAHTVQIFWKLINQSERDINF